MSFLDQQQPKFQAKYEEAQHKGATLFRFWIGLFVAALLYLSSYAGFRYGHVIVKRHDEVMASPETSVPMLSAYRPLMRAEQVYNKFHHSGM